MKDDFAETYELMMHLPFDLNASVDFNTRAPDRDDKFLLSICDYYKGRKDLHKLERSVWSDNLYRHMDFHAALTHYDFNALHNMLSRMFSTGITHGTNQGENHFKKLKENESFREVMGYMTLDVFMALLQWFEIVEVFSPEEFQFDTNLSTARWVTDHAKSGDADAFMLRLEQKYDFDASAPKYTKDLFGFKMKRGIYSLRDFWALGVALEIKTYIQNNRLDINRICEIGGGVGHLAYYLTRLGFSDISIVDLPTVSVSQMYFLGTNLPKHNIKLLEPKQFESQNYDLVVNVDSFVEMNKDVALEYLRTMKKGTRLLSINHERIFYDEPEDKFTVSGLAEKAGLRKLSRDLFWLRKGYVKEYYIKDEA